MILITLIGRIGKDPETRVTTTGQKVTTFSLATDVTRGGQKENNTVWWRVTVWGDRFDKMMPYFTKGKAVTVVGTLSRAPEIWTGQDGQPRVNALEITAEMLQFVPMPPREGEGQQQQGFQTAKPTAPKAMDSFAAPAAAPASNVHAFEEDEINKDDLPF
jgi:single-strand DNA-binding protein